MKTLSALITLLVCASPAQGAAPQWADFLASAAAKRLPAGARVEVKDARVPFAAGARVRITSFVPEQPLGLVSFEAEVERGGQVQRTRGTATIHAFVPVAVAAAPLSNAEALTAANTRFEPREISRLVQAGYFLSLDALKSRSARGYVNAGQVLGKQTTQLSPVVAQGQFVDLVRRKAGFTLTAKVRAMQSGRLDQWIPVQNPSSGKMLQAKVVGPNEVEVN